MALNWKSPRGFSSRRVAAECIHNNHKLRVDCVERVCGRFIDTGRFYAYIDNKFIAHTCTLQGAKTAIELMLNQ